MLCEIDLDGLSKRLYILRQDTIHAHQRPGGSAIEQAAKQAIFGRRSQELLKFFSCFQGRLPL